MHEVTPTGSAKSPSRLTLEVLGGLLAGVVLYLLIGCALVLWGSGMNLAWSLIAACGILLLFFFVASVAIRRRSLFATASGVFVLVLFLILRVQSLASPRELELSIATIVAGASNSLLTPALGAVLLSGVFPRQGKNNKTNY